MASLKIIPREPKSFEKGEHWLNGKNMSLLRVTTVQPRQARASNSKTSLLVMGLPKEASAEEVKQFFS